MPVTSSVNTKTTVGTVLIEPVPPVPSPTGGEASAGRADEAGVDEPDEQDEQADTGGDRELELHRHGVEDEPAQPGRRQDAR